MGAGRSEDDGAPLPEGAIIAGLDRQMLLRAVSAV